MQQCEPTAKQRPATRRLMGRQPSFVASSAHDLDARHWKWCVCTTATRFSSQQIVPAEHEPDSVCCGKDTLFVFSSGCKVATFSVAHNGCEPICTFSTLGKVQKITYSDRGNYLAAIEENNKVLSLHVYLNWRRCQTREISRVSIRMVGHALHAPFIGAPKDQLEIIEVPLSEPPVSIACCPVKGDLIVGCQNKVVLFRLKEGLADGESPVLDFERFLIVHVALELLEVAFCNGCLALVSDLEVLVLKLQNVQDMESERQPQIPPKALPPNKEMYGEDNKPAEDSLSQGQDDFVLFQGPLELLGEDASGSGVIISLECTGTEGLNTEPRDCLHFQQILYRRFTPDLSHIYLEEKTSLHSLQLLPIFAAGDSESSSSPGSKEKRTISLFCFFSLPHKGYLYSVGNMVQELSAYSYPEKAKQAVLSSQLLHIITRNHLLCYSVRCSAVAARDVDPEIDTNNKACPPFFLPVCALRMQLFIGLRAVCHSRNHLILLAKAEVNAPDRQTESKKGLPQRSRTVNNAPPATANSGWNLYCLQVIPTVHLCREMVEYSLKYKTCSPQSYAHLLSEAHLILKAAILDPDLGQSDSKELLSAFRENCLQLGDCFSQFEVDDFHFTLPYYKMSGKSLSDLISRIPLWENEPQKFGKGFMYFLKHLVYEEIEDPLSAEMANQVLQVFKLTEPTQIPHALCSPCMRNVCLRTAWDHLERLDSIRQSPLVSLTKATVALRIEDQHKYHKAMRQYPEMRLVSGFVEEPNLVRHHGVVATDLSRELERTQPGLLVVAFVALLKSDKITLEEADLFFKGLCGRDNKIDEAETPQVLVDFWEATLISFTEEVVIERLLMKLVSVYLQRTARKLNPDQKPLKTVEELINSCGHFKKIYPWIHIINESSSQLPSEDLQKLQSILCGSSIDITSVLHLLQQLPDDDAAGLSIRALCDTRLGKCEQVTDLLLDRCPEALLSFAACEMQQGNQPLWWKKLLPELCERTRGPGGANQILVSSLQETLAVVASVLPPLDFLRLLPDDGTASFFLPHLLECSRKSSIS
ncbi:Hermansky-Pudlak syndrome 3 protein isoform X2 [Amblyraja radiata]|uniref:Hermansky-Pudlak syndrome 3 protein isoform X2 n=1 Tax=Amblyraja radiata TaxID=386614 RepID=UPI001403BB51|nr:Hermansky-Pudlak syndrome 3 protein isoform X2 [Amblyraja radiata]